MIGWDILIIDNSASMSLNKKDIVEGFNNLLSQQQKENSTNLFTVISFNDTVELFKEGKFTDISEIDYDEIITKGKTALFDAVGEVYDMILDDYYMYKNITLTVITDGKENSSEKYTIQKLNEKKKLIDEKQFTFKMVFIGADISCITESELNTHSSQNVDCSGDIKEALKVASETMSSSREGSQYTPEGIVDINSVEQCVMKRSFSLSDEIPTKVKRCKTFCKN